MTNDERATPVGGGAAPSTSAERGRGSVPRTPDVAYGPQRRSRPAPRSFYDVRPRSASEALPPAVAPVLATLRASVVAYVRARRRDDVPVSRVVAEVWALVHEAEPDPRAVAGLAAIVARVVRWTVDAYDDDPGMFAAQDIGC